MTEAEARHQIRVHAGFVLDETAPGIVARLRPYIGIEDADLADLVESLVRVHGEHGDERRRRS